MPTYVLVIYALVAVLILGFVSTGMASLLAGGYGFSVVA